MSEVDDVISRLTAKQQNYLNSYFTYAPESLKSSIQVVRMPAGTTFIQEGAPLDKVFILLKGSVSAVDYRVRETVYGFCHFEPIEIFGTMEILGYMSHYKTTLATTQDSLFLKIPGGCLQKMDPERRVCPASGNTADHWLSAGAVQKERLYVMLPGNERVYLILTNLYETYGKRDTYSVYLSRKDFSEVTGVSERTITRALKDLEEQKLISRDGWNIVMTWEQYRKIRELVRVQINETGE
ncbi:MAG: Crp/Fnr family transcriptional regulator [Clostridium sp.]